MALSCNFIARGAGTIILALAILPLLPLPGQVVVIHPRGQTDAATGDGDCQGENSIRYRTRLTGMETEWSDWGGTTARAFTHLPGRAFTVELQARIRDGRESPVTTLAFAFAPPWWLTRWAFGAYGLSFIAAVGALITFHARMLRRRAARLESLVAERTAELSRLRQIDRDESAAARLAAEKNRLEMLRYQLNPHFLYNALNSIRALSFSQPPAAGDMVLQLAEFCRITLTRREDAAPVTEEFAMLRLYLDMEKIRWRDKLTVEIDLTPDAAAHRIPPFLLLPLVENALKHGRQSTAGAIPLHLRLSARLDPATRGLRLEVANTGTWLEPGRSSAPSTGIGLENLRQRLRRFYPDAHTFTTTEADGWVMARLHLGPVAIRAPRIDHA